MAKADHHDKRQRNSVPSGKSRESQVTEGYTRINWLSVSFTPAQKHRIAAEEFDIGRAFDNLASLIEKGCKLVINPRNSSGFVGASIIGHTEECPYKGIGLSGEGGSVYSALRSLCAKLDILEWELYIDTIESPDDFR